MNQRLSAKIKEWERDLDRLRPMEREYEYLKNQNLTYSKSIESYQSRYNELKKYCIKIEAAYSKFVANKKKNSGLIESGKLSIIDDNKQDKEIQEKFIDLSKRMNDCELTYYRQQIQDLNDQKTFIGIYYDRKWREERDKINEAKDMNEQEKKNAIVAK